MIWLFVKETPDGPTGLRRLRRGLLRRLVITIGARMRILHVIASADPRTGGPIEGVLQQSISRGQQGHAVELATLDVPSANFLQTYPIKVHALGLRSYTPSLRTIFLWRRYGYTPHLIPWLRHNIHRYDLVVVNGLWNFSACAARFSLIDTKKPYVVFIHGMLDPWFKHRYPLKAIAKQLVWLFIEGPLINKARAVLFTTQDEAARARNAFWPDRAKQQVVGYGTRDAPDNAPQQIAAFHRQVPALRDKSFVLFLGRIHEKKGCDLLVEAFGRFAAERTDLDLVIAGPDEGGLVPRLQSRAATLEIAHRLHWAGLITGAAKWGAFRAATAFILPSHQENFGIAVAEALACGCPVLISDKVNIWREVVADGGGLVEPDTEEGAVALLRRYFALTQTERERMRQAARACFLHRFEASEAFRSIDRIFEAVVRGDL